MTSVGQALLPAEEEWGALDTEEAAVAWTVPDYPRKRVDAAGECLARLLDVPFAESEIALGIVNNWRSSHSFPLNTFQNGLRRRASQIESDPIVSQRIKRLSSLLAKLRRFRTMKLSQMQDIGGCRAVVASAEKVAILAELYKEGRERHELDHVDDYIQSPKRSGYRGIHMIYRYRSDRNETYNGLKIEVQLRSPLQHAWATAVETVGTFTQQALKSSQGHKDWLSFFSLMGSALAFQEGTPLIPETPTDWGHHLKSHASSLRVVERLGAFGATINELGKGRSDDAYYYVLKLDVEERELTWQGFRMNELKEAMAEYEEIERSIAQEKHTHTNAVLVHVSSVASLRKAYPNYFLDTQIFIDALRATLGE